MAILHEPTFWVTVAFVAFIALAYKKVAAIGTKALDGRAERIRVELDEARRLREEAEALLAEYKRRQGDYLKEAETILAAARRDADALSSYTEKELRAALDARMKQAVEKIAQEESRAVADVRNHVVDISLAAARNIIADHISTMPQEELIRLALSDLERKVH